MINRIGEFNCLDEKEFLKLESILNNNKKVEAKYDNKKEAELHKNIKKNTSIEQNIDGYYVVDNYKVRLSDAISTGLFKKVSWGSYLYNGRNTTFPDKYSFDDGSIWKIEVDENGNEYLVKQVDDDNNLIRTAKNNEEVYINNSNYNNAIKVLSLFKDDNDLLKFLLNDEGIQKILFNYINDNIKEYIKNYLTINSIESESLLNDIMNIIGRMLKNNDIKNLKDLDNVIKTICEKTTNKLSKDYSFFKE